MVVSAGESHAIEVEFVPPGGLGGLQRVGALDCSPDALFLDDREDSGVDEFCDVPIEARGWDVGEFGLELGCREGAVSEEGLKDS